MVGGEYRVRDGVEYRVGDGIKARGRVRGRSREGMEVGMRLCIW